MKGIPIFETPRLILDGYRDRDEEQISRILHEEDIFRNVFGFNESHRERFSQNLKDQSQLDAPDMAHWLIRLTHGARLIGCIKAGCYRGASVEIVYFLTAGERSRGYGSEAVAKIVEHLESLKGVTKLWASARSAESCRILAKLSFEPLYSYSSHYVRRINRD